MGTAPDDLDEPALLDALRSTVQGFVAAGFERVTEDQHHPTWIRERGPEADADADKVVLWRHPRAPGTLHGHVATTQVGHMVHLRFFDPDWRPETIFPGHIDKGWDVADPAELASVDRALTTLWPRALSWFEAPVSPDDVLAEHGRVATVVAPGPLLERHRQRARWLAERNRAEEAAHVRDLIARIEALYDDAAQ